MSKHLAVTSETVAAATPVDLPIAGIAGIETLGAPKPAKCKSRSPAVSIELVATVGLALSTLVAITVVSIGIARADFLGTRANAVTAPIVTMHHD